MKNTKLIIFFAGALINNISAMETEPLLPQQKDDCIIEISALKKRHFNSPNMLLPPEILKHIASFLSVEDKALHSFFLPMLGCSNEQEAKKVASRIYSIITAKAKNLDDWETRLSNAFSYCKHAETKQLVQKYIKELKDADKESSHLKIGNITIASIEELQAQLAFYNKGIMGIKSSQAATPDDKILLLFSFGAIGTSAWLLTQSLVHLDDDKTKAIVGIVIGSIMLAVGIVSAPYACREWHNRRKYLKKKVKETQAEYHRVYTELCRRMELPTSEPNTN